MSATAVSEASGYANVEYQTLPVDSNDMNASEAGDTEPRRARRWRSRLKSRWSRLKSWWRRRFSGWRGGVVASITATSIVLLLNIILAIVAATAGHPEGGFATVYRGSCTVAPRLFEGLQLIVNLLSTVLLGASNYCMQRLVAPNREEINAAHARKKWLDIGKPSIRNLSSINWMRVVLWGSLCLSSLPLHFVYNSVIVKIQATYDVYFLNVDPAVFTGTNTTWWHENDGWSNLQSMLSNGKYLDQAVWKNITSDECISSYQAPYLTRGHGFGVPTLEVRNQEGVNALSPVFNWYYSHGEVPVNTIQDPVPRAFDLSYCLSQEVPGRCGIQFSLTIIYVVIACNILKIVTMVVILWKFDKETIVTVGDGIQSFIQAPDPTTKDCCLEPRHDIVRAWKMPPESRRGQTFRGPSKESWFLAASWKRWTIPIVLYGVATGIAIWLAKKNSTSCQNYIITKNRCALNGFGKLSPHYLLDVSALEKQNSVIPYVLVANTPQVIASIFYFTYNGLFTSMLANREWAQYSIKRAPLRVSIPKPGQRSTYFLQLPYIYSIPLMALSLLFHWFISQAIFFTRVITYSADDPTETFDTENDLGYSMYALIASIICGTVLIVACLLVGVIGRYPAKGMPMGGTNSAIISAACHVNNINSEQDKSIAEENLVSRPLQWGVTREGSRDTAGHCSFSDGEVKTPTVGFLYAGLR